MPHEGAGGSLAEAAEFLGISAGYGPWRRGGGRVYSAAGLARSAVRQLPDPPGFETELASLTRELSAPGTPLVNYQRRRQALEAWSINGDAWPKLAARRTLMARPESGDRKRQIASVYVWVRVTSGERCFAPRPIEAAQPAEVQENWQRSWDVIWRQLLHTSDPRSHYTRFRAELDALAAALAKTIDTAGHTHLKVAPTKPPTITGDAAIYSWEPDVRQPSMADAS